MEGEISHFEVMERWKQCVCAELCVCREEDISFVLCSSAVKAQLFSLGVVTVFDFASSTPGHILNT